MDCEECGIYIGSIDNTWYSTYLDMVFCEECWNNQDDFIKDYDRDAPIACEGTGYDCNVICSCPANERKIRMKEAT